jgi:hypothetical protein
MSTIIFDSVSHTAPYGQSAGYLSNVARAARGLAAALLAVPPVAEVTAVAQPEVRSAAKVKNVAALFRMARQYDSVMPNLAAELRSLAARD